MTSSISEVYSYALHISVRRRAFLLVVFESALFPDAQLLLTAKGFQLCMYTHERRELPRKTKKSALKKETIN